MAADGTSSAAAASGEAFTLEEALALRQQGNEHFKQGQFVEACGCYRRALDDVRRFEALPAATGGSCSDLSAAVRLNLVACLVREEFGEVDTALALCNEVLSQDRDCAKALFRRGQVWLSKSGKCQDQASRRDCLSSARADLLQVAKATPGDKDVRSLLEQITEALKETAPATSSRSGSGLFQGLYSDKDRQEPPPPPVICSTCGRIGHPACGKAGSVACERQGRLRAGSAIRLGGYRSVRSGLVLRRMTSPRNQATLKKMERFGKLSPTRERRLGTHCR
eukprot:TRINITY_DN30190_c0_g1_i2.p1 TRINITY_DN30190_c0_g1~~TRINITY_DN30190_c0_g1_i2.p1  ORF type:complete len:280 (-),score=41.99 TRINITY_DN30190_c0_g1_i2:254-1093(-)